MVLRHPFSFAKSLLLFAGASCLFGASAAQALTVTTSSAFGESASVADVEHAGATSNNGVPLGSTSIGQFDPNLGVLTGASIALTGTRTQTIQVSATDGPNNGNNHAVTTTGTGGNAVSFSAPGATFTSSQMNANGSCSGQRLEACTGSVGQNSSPTGATMAVGAAALNAYVGTGTVTGSRTASLLWAMQENGSVFTGTESTAYSVAWAGTIATSYEYLLHAAPSFDATTTQFTLDIDFGASILGDAAEEGFSIFNLLGERAGLDLDGITGSGDTSRFSTGLTGFTDLAAGLDEVFLASMDTSQLGDYAASYILSLSDADVGTANSRFSYVLTLNLMGKVIAPRPLPTNLETTTGTVPEPSSIALAGIALAGIALGRWKSLHPTRT